MKKSVFTEQRDYFDKLRLIFYVQSKETIDANSQKFKNTETNVMNVSR